MKKLLDVINRGILRGLNENENNVELLADLDDENLDQLDSVQSKSINNKVDYSIKQQLTDAIQTGKLHNRLKQIINNHANFDKFKGIIKANDKDHLLELITIGQKLLGDDGNFNWIDTSEITDMSNLFYKNKRFNGHIELWNVSNVTNMGYMFNCAYKFNQPIGGWDVSNVTTMEYMFNFAEKFNQLIGGWDVSRVTNMESMFKFAEKFNQPIGGWDVSNVTNMTQVFYNADRFNQPIGDWDVSNVTTMVSMFEWAISFNQDISQWNVKNVKDYSYIFYNCPIKAKYKPKGIFY